MSDCPIKNKPCSESKNIPIYDFINGEVVKNVKCCKLCAENYFLTEKMNEVSIDGFSFLNGEDEYPKSFAEKGIDSYLSFLKNKLEKILHEEKYEKAKEIDDKIRKIENINKDKKELELQLNNSSVEDALEIKEKLKKVFEDFMDNL